VVRLFTNIDQADLVTRIRRLFKRAWRQHQPILNASRAAHDGFADVNDMVLQVFDVKSPPVWHVSLPTCGTNVRHMHMSYTGRLVHWHWAHG
jgi:hypothetical protein